MKAKVKFKNIDDLIWFTATTNNLHGDINLMDGRIVCDAKSLVALLNLDLSKVFGLELISEDEEDIEIFNQLKERYALK